MKSVRAKPKLENQPIDRIFAVLDAVVRARRPVSLVDVATASRLPAPTAHRLVGNLEQRGFLKRTMKSRKFLLPGPRLTQLSRHALEASIVADQPHGVLEQLASEVQEHCQIGTVTNNEVLYVDAVQIRRTSGLQLEQGRSAPLHCTSMGKLYLASLDDQEFLYWIRGRRLEKITPNTITDGKALAEHVRKIRQRGWASSDQEYGLGIVGCSVVIPTAESRNFFAVGVSAPAARVPHASLEAFIDPLKRAAARIAAVVDHA